MCCLIMALSILGPRAMILFWWLSNPARWDNAFSGWVWPVLGFVFAPWTTLMFVLIRPATVAGFDWVWMALAVLADVAMYAGNAYKREEVPGYATYSSARS